MQATYSIRKFLALALLFAFTIGVTPKLYFHDLFSNHKDLSCGETQSGKAQINSYKFNCGFVTVEGTAPFLEAEPIDFGNTLIGVLCEPQIYISQCVKLRPVDSQYRGPPGM